MKASVRNFAITLTLVSSWAFADAPKTVQSATTKVTVEVDGPTFDQAKQRAFKEAIQQAVGVVIVSEQEAKGDKLSRDFIGSYSSGYVDDFELLESYQESDHWHVKMNVQVASSKIAQRMLSSGKADLLVDGQRIAAQIDTQLEQRHDGDQLIATVLGTYPENAYVINTGQTEFGISRLRKPYLEIDYSLSMSKFWVDSLNEAVGLVAVENKQCGSFKNALAKGINNTNVGLKVKSMVRDICGDQPDMRIETKASGAWLPGSNNYYFADAVTLQTVNDQLQSTIGRNHVGLRVELLDAGGNLVDQGCFKLDSRYFVGFENPAGTYNLNKKRANMRPVILGQNTIKGKLQVGISSDIPLDDIARVRLAVQKTCD